MSTPTTTTNTRSRELLERAMTVTPGGVQHRAAQDRPAAVRPPRRTAPTSRTSTATATSTTTPPTGRSCSATPTPRSTSAWPRRSGTRCCSASARPRSRSSVAEKIVEHVPSAEQARRLRQRLGGDLPRDPARPRRHRPPQDPQVPGALPRLPRLRAAQRHERARADRQARSDVGRDAGRGGRRDDRLPLQRRGVGPRGVRARGRADRRHHRRAGRPQLPEHPAGGRVPRRRCARSATSTARCSSSTR